MLLALILLAAPDLDSRAREQVDDHHVPEAVFHHGENVCLAFRERSFTQKDSAPMVWQQRFLVVFEGGERELELVPPAFAKVADSCGADAATYAFIVEESCSNGMDPALADAKSFSFALPDPGPKLQEAIDRWRPKPVLEFAGQHIGCAYAVTSPDQKLRVWTVMTSHRGENYPETNLTRGEAYIQWSDGKGVEMLMDGTARRDLLLDSTIDLVTPLPGGAGWVLSGWGQLGGGNNRFVEVVRLGSGGPVRVPGAFVTAGIKRDVLAITGPFPDGSSHQRYEMLYNFSVRFDAATGRLSLERRPNLMESAKRFASQWQPVTLASWNGTRFVADVSTWGEVHLSK